MEKASPVIPEWLVVNDFNGNSYQVVNFVLSEAVATVTIDPVPANSGQYSLFDMEDEG